MDANLLMSQFFYKVQIRTKCCNRLPKTTASQGGHSKNLKNSRTFPEHFQVFQEQLFYEYSKETKSLNGNFPCSLILDIFILTLKSNKKQHL